MEIKLTAKLMPQPCVVDIALGVDAGEPEVEKAQEEFFNDFMLPIIQHYMDKLNDDLGAIVDEAVRVAKEVQKERKGI